ncbi:hypothetical protein GCM10023191_014120 [Actinoallomurus oryzae]|uniref:Lipopolysaccharide assembly protein A domain-containing protein n=1 Tax=Actinoallomurus oryzae TaxID=502180 RepID=A0ABP8PJG9_9ACTN
MVFLGVIVAVVAVVVGIEVIVQNSSSASLEVFGYHVPGVHTESQVFVVGVIVAFFAGAGLAVSWLSLLRKMRVRRELHDLREEREETMASLERKNQQLERELSRVRGRATSAPVTTDVPVSSGRRRDREPVSPFFDSPA